jgi:hypothetical protein
MHFKGKVPVHEINYSAIPLLLHKKSAVILYRAFQKELNDFESLYKFLQRTCTVFGTVIMYQNLPSFTWDSYSSILLSVVMQGVSKRALRSYSKCYCVATFTKTFTLEQWIAYTP